MLTKKEIFDTVIAPKVTPIQKPEEIAQEFNDLKEQYGIFITQAAYCERKGVTQQTLIKYLKRFKEAA